MRLLQAVGDGRLGGGTTHVLQLVEAIVRELPVEVHLLTQGGSPAALEARRRGAIVHGADFFASRVDPRVWLRVRRVLREVQPDLIHTHGARAGLPVSQLAGKVPLFYSVRGYHFSRKPPGIRQLAIAAERLCHRRADLTLFVADHDRELARRVGLLPACRDHRVIKNSLQLDRIPRATGSEDGRLLGFLARLVPQKAPHVALEILHRLRGEGYRLRVIGDGELMPDMRRRTAQLRLEDAVEYLGALPRESALEALAGTDVMLLPSLWEGFPHTPLEALAMGVPVVAHAVGGVPEIVADRRTGLLLDDLDPDRWADAVRTLVRDPDLRRQVVDGGRALVQSQFSWAANRQTYLDLYRQALGLA